VQVAALRPPNIPIECIRKIVFTLQSWSLLSDRCKQSITTVPLSLVPKDELQTGLGGARTENALVNPVQQIQQQVHCNLSTFRKMGMSDKFSKNVPTDVY